MITSISDQTILEIKKGAYENILRQHIAQMIVKLHESKSSSKHYNLPYNELRYRMQYSKLAYDDP